MEISLIRHGQSTLVENRKMSGDEFNDWVSKYDEVGVFERKTYPSETIQKISEAHVVLTSDLKRSIESAKFLKVDSKMTSNILFRETELPKLSLKISLLKLKPSTWAVILRTLWFMGYSNDCESKRMARIRAEKAALMLVEYAKTYNSVALVGHGFLHMFIAKELRKMGMQGQKRTNSTHWGVTTYRLLD